jgi:hypothetical protein
VLQTICANFKPEVRALGEAQPVGELIEAAVDMSGPLTSDEIEKLFRPFSSKRIAMKIAAESVYFTRKAYVAQVRTAEGKTKPIHMKERTISSSLDVLMAHITNVLNELVHGCEVFE